MIEAAFGEVYNDIAKVANIPGFRVGKAPVDMVRLHYAKDAKEEVLKRLIPEAYRRAVQEHKIDPVGMPDISDVSFVEDKALTFKAKVDIRPKFRIKDYKAIGIEKKKVAIGDADVNKALESLREVGAKYLNVEDRPVQPNDYVVTDLECSSEGKSVQKKREGLWLSIDKESFAGGLAEKMVGMKKLEERDIDVTLPENYPDKNYAGKKVVYRVLIKEIKERRLPAVDDEFARDMGRQSIDDLKKEIARELEERGKAGADVEAENKLLGKLIDDNVFKVPSSFVARQLGLMVDNAKRRLEEKGLKRDDLDKKDGEFKEKFKQDAERQVRLLFILDTIAGAENIDATDDDVASAYKSMAAQAEKTEEFVRDYYEREELVDNLRDKIRESKTIKFLLDSAKITEK